MILPLAMVAQLASTCAPQIAPETIVGIAQTESRLNPLAIHDNTDKRSYAPEDTAEALAIARRLVDMGHSLDSGITQINNRNYAFLGITLEQSFDPCRAMAATAALLTSFSRYNTGSPTRGILNGYSARVVSASSEPNSPRTSRAVPHGAGISSPEESGAKPHAWNAFPDAAEIVQPGENDGLVER